MAWHKVNNMSLPNKNTPASASFTKTFTLYYLLVNLNRMLVLNSKQPFIFSYTTLLNTYFLYHVSQYFIVLKFSCHPLCIFPSPLLALWLTSRCPGVKSSSGEELPQMSLTLLLNYWLIYYITCIQQPLKVHSPAEVNRFKHIRKCPPLLCIVQTKRKKVYPLLLKPKTSLLPRKPLLKDTFLSSLSDSCRIAASLNRFKQRARGRAPALFNNYNNNGWWRANLLFSQCISKHLVRLSCGKCISPPDRIQF